MLKRRTSRVRNRKQVRELKANVMSPRIFWLDVRHALGQLLKLLLVAGLVGAVIYGAWRALDEGLFKNQEFRLQHIKLSDNPAVDEIRLLNVAGIDPNGSLFDCDAGEIERRLQALPEVAGAKVQRHFPGTLEVEISCREPFLWISMPEQGLLPRDRASGLVVDRMGIAFPCPRGRFEAAQALPVIELRPGEWVIEPGKKVEHPDFLRGLRLFSVASSATPDALSWIDTIRQHKAWATKLTTRDGMEATFGHDHLKRQMNDLLAAVQHARDKGARIATITLIGKRNLPLTYAQEPPPKALPVETQEDEAPPAGERDLRNLLER